MNLENFKNKYQKTPLEHYPNQVNDNPMVSICVFTYQHYHYIDDCLESVLTQKANFKYEIVLLEDESTDGTRDICKRYAKKYPKKIRLILNSRKNNIHINDKPTSRFNCMYGFLAARGDYIAICEGDDLWTDSYKLKKQIGFLDSNPDYTLSAHEVEIMCNGITIDKGLKDHSITGDFYLNREGSSNVPSALSMVFKKKILPKKAKQIDRHINAEYPFLLYLLKNAKGRYIHETMGRKRLDKSDKMNHAISRWKW